MEARGVELFERGVFHPDFVDAEPRQSINRLETTSDQSTGGGDRWHHYVETKRRIFETSEAILLIKPRGALVLGVDDHGHGSDLSASVFAAIESVPEESRSKPLPLMVTRDGKSAHQRRWNAGLTTELLGHLFGNVVEEHCCCTEGVVTFDFSRLGSVNEDVCDGGPPFHFLARLGTQEGIEGFDAAIEALAVMSRG